jgi:hypothetical protein
MLSKRISSLKFSQINYNMFAITKAELNFVNMKHKVCSYEHWELTVRKKSAWSLIT